MLVHSQTNVGTTELHVFTLLPRFELNLQATLFREDQNAAKPNFFTTNVYGKFMFWVNEKNTGGAAVFQGIGKSDGVSE